MKSTITFLFFILCINTGDAQNYVLGATDTIGDIGLQLDAPDAKAIYHAYDQVSDSLWFKLEFYSRTDNISWNIKIGIDTNNNFSSAGIWPGQNQSMNYDILADVYSNPAFPPALGNLYDENGVWISSNISIQFPDTNIVVLGLRLSEIYQPGNFINYIAGSGIVLGIVNNDDIPDASYISIFGTTAILESSRSNDIKLFPNPVGNSLYISTTDKLIEVHLFDIRNAIGEIVESGTLNRSDQKINAESLSPGLYFINIYGDQFNSVQKFVKH